MLFFIVAWTGLTAACFAIGSAILTGVRDDCLERDRLILSVWLGVVILAVTLLAVSVVLPLSALVGAAVTVCLLAIAVGQHRYPVLLITSPLMSDFAIQSRDLEQVLSTNLVISY